MKKEDLLKYCRYYNGEENTPYNSDRLNLIWFQEKKWVEDTMDVNVPMSSIPPTISTPLDYYLGYHMQDFEKFDDTPITLKAYLFMYFLKGNELPLREDFEKFYALWKAKKVDE